MVEIMLWWLSQWHLKFIHYSSLLLTAHYIFAHSLSSQEHIEKRKEDDTMAKSNWSFLIISLTAYTIVWHIVLPNYVSYWKPLLLSVNFPATRFFDPSVDDTLNIQLLGALLAYIIMGGACTMADFMFPKSWTLDMKTQGAKSFFTCTEWAEAVGMSLLNFFIFSWLVTVPTYYYIQKEGMLRGGSAMHPVEENFSYLWAAVHFVAHVNIIDVWFYSTHRILHWGPLYNWIHKQHHRFKAPNAVACTYANPIEFNLGNVLGVVLGPALTNCHPYAGAYWMAFSLASTAGSHSGYYLLGAQDHDRHHEFFSCNYGTGVFMDRLFQTEWKPPNKSTKTNTKTKVKPS